MKGRTDRNEAWVPTKKNRRGGGGYHGGLFEVGSTLEGGVRCFPKSETGGDGALVPDAALSLADNPHLVR